MTLREALTEGIGILKSSCPSAFIDTPGLDASILLADVLQTGRTELLVHGNKPIDEEDREKFQRFLERRRNGECIAYILGRKEFRNLEFTVNPHVLVPRPETETLLEAALEYVDLLVEQGNRGPSILDLCTGSGALALSLANERPNVTITASDISTEALETAAFNAARLLDGGRNSVRFIHSDLFENIPERFNIIISNPPYIPTEELSALAPEVLREPRLALDGGENGLELIRKIISRARDHLLPNGALLLEASPEQMPEIKAFLEKNNFDGVTVLKDLAGRQRVISGYNELHNEEL